VQQRIEISKALAQDARVLVMDEPTARLSEVERGWLFDTMRRLAGQGVGVMFISHFLEEVLAVTDWVTVLRNGRSVGSEPTGRLSVPRMVELMLGPELKGELDREAHLTHADDQRDLTLVAEHLEVGPRLRQVSVGLRAGEILGVAGLVGSGRTRLCRALAGVDRPTAGTLQLRGQRVRFSSPRDAIDRGIVLIPEDRKNQGLALIAPLEANLSLMALRRRLGRGGLVSRREVKALARTLIRDLEVSPATPSVPAGTLSGGNQQKIVLGKALAARPDIFIVDQPTAGVDVGTKAQIHRLLRQRAEDGASVLVVSDDLDELYTLSDRFCVMRDGTVLWQGPSAGLDREQLLALIATGRRAEPTDSGRPGPVPGPTSDGGPS
jgi:ABC-type sugar transport system ATPase subunit